MKILLTKIILLAAGVMLSFTSIAQQPLPTGFYGDGSNESLRVLDGETYYTDDVRAEILNFQSSFSFTINTPAPSIDSFKVGSIVLIIGMKSCDANTRNWEFNIIDTVVNGSNIFLVHPLTSGNIYVNPQVIQIKQFMDLTVNVGGKITCHPWDGSTGGVISFLVNDSLKIRGLIEANGKGFEVGTPGLGGTAGNGGFGGMDEGDFGKDNPGLGGYVGLTNYGEGIGGAGNGAISGSMHQNNNTSATLPAICCGCLTQPATNLSLLIPGISNQKRILMGASGASADGGIAGDGAGGAGGDSPLCDDFPYKGGDGGNGGNSGVGGLGGRGGGVILFKAVTIVFDSLGKIQANGAEGENGSDGENGGQGGVPNENEGAGGGNGAGGGQAGSGGNAGAPGQIYFIKSNPLVNPTIQQLGALGGAAGKPGAGGPPGGEAELGKNPNCPLTFLCACTDVWEMINESVATPDPFDNNINTYTKVNSVCIATTEDGKLSVSCTNLTTGDIYKCDMQQLDGNGNEINNYNPAECLHTLSLNSGMIPSVFTSCNVKCPPSNPNNSFFKATACPCGGGRARYRSVQGAPGLPGDSGLTSLETPYFSDDTPSITVDSVVQNCDGSCNGIIYFSFSGGNPSSYTVKLNGVINNSNPFTDLCAGTYVIEVTDGDGNIAQTTVNICPTCKSNNSKRIDVCGVSFNSNIMIECFYIGGGEMNNCLFIVGESPDPTDADIIFISAMNANWPYEEIDRQQGILKTNGNVTVTFGPNVIAGSSYYLKVNHRNSICAWSAVPVTLNQSTFYSFSSAVTQAFASNEIITFDSFYAALYSGDINQDGAIDGSDFLEFDESNQLGAGGYNGADLNGDGAVDATDFLCMDHNLQNGIGCALP